MAAPLFELISELQTLTRRDFALAAPTILNPLNATPLVEGEFLELDSSYKLARGTGEGIAMNVFPVHTERGRYDTQAIQKVNVLYLGMYEAETQIMDQTALSVGDALSIQDVTVSAVVRRGVKKVGATVNRVVIGYVSKITSATKVRFIHMGNTRYVV